MFKLHKNVDLYIHKSVAFITSANWNAIWAPPRQLQQPSTQGLEGKVKKRKVRMIGEREGKQMSPNTKDKRGQKDSVGIV
jgi:hypothetical protein